VAGRSGVRGQNVRRPAGTTERVAASAAVTTHYLNTVDDPVTETTPRRRPVHRPPSVPVGRRTLSSRLFWADWTHEDKDQALENKDEDETWPTTFKEPSG